jgi:carbon-monoxide dehydrogenase medium subunit
MKPPPFAYARPATVDEACALLAEHGEDARLLAGGQSLMATLNMRLSAPELLIDINRIDELAGISLAGDALRIGAMTRHVDVETSPEIARHAPLIAEAMPNIAHAAIRNRGTFGGSIAFADPAAELPACAVALGARFELRSTGATRTVAADDFFHGLYDTELAPGEMLTAVEIPVIAPGYRSAFMELARRHGDYAMVGIAVHARLADGVIGDARLVYFAAGERPVVGRAAAAAIDGKAPSEETFEAAAAALDGDLDPPADLNADPATRLHLARVLTRRALAQWAA